MRISVIIPCFNAASTIEACVEAALAGTLRPGEVIVVDDASTDTTREIVAALASRWPETVRLVCLEVNGGPARGRNHGAAVATGDFLFFLDSDTQVMPDALANFAARIGSCDAVTGIYHHQPINPGRVPLYKATLNFYLFSRDGLIGYETFSASCAGIRADVFRELGGFNESLAWGMDYENEEFGRRIILRHRLLLDPSVAARHAFPGLEKLTRTYFTRVSLWMEFFLKRGQFESGGTATASGGLGTASVPPFLLFAACALVWPVAGFACLPFLALWLYNYAGYLRFVARRHPAFLPVAIVLNLFFSCVITAGAVQGAAHALLGKTRVVGPSASE